MRWLISNCESKWGGGGLNFVGFSGLWAQYGSNFPGETTWEVLTLEPETLLQQATSCLQGVKAGNNESDEEGHSATTLLKAS